MSRRARNEISRNRAWALAAADLYDEGLTDAKVAQALSVQFGRRFSERTCSSFRKAEYDPIAKSRVAKRDAARRVEMVMSGAGGTYAQAGQELLAKMLYDILESGDSEIEPKDLVNAGKTFAKIRELDVAEMKARYEIEMKKRAAEQERRVREAAKSAKERGGLTDEDLATIEEAARML